MIAINPNQVTAFSFAPNEKRALLQFCTSLDAVVCRKIQVARDGIVPLSPKERWHLCQCLADTLGSIDRPPIQEILGRLLHRLTPGPQAQAWAEELSDLEFQGPEALNAKLQEITDACNAAPDPEMGGLSPNQVTRLIYLPWDDAGFPMKLNRHLPYSQLQHATFLTNARILLGTLLELEHQTTATATGNLNRKLIKSVFDRLVMDEKTRDGILRYNKVLNETDVWPLHITRVVCEAAGLIRRRKNRFHLSKEAKRLLADQNVGQLYYRLFGAHFSEFNLSYLDGLPDLYSVQQTIVYTLYRFAKMAGTFTPLDEFAGGLFLPVVMQEIRTQFPSHARLDWLLESRIVRPLRDFGLLECTYKQTKSYARIDEVRKGTLFDEFITFEF